MALYMTGIASTVGNVLTGTVDEVVTDATYAVQHAFDGVSQTLPSPPVLPPLHPPAPPLIICPPAAPPPLAPPSFRVWAMHVPSWFWIFFLFLVCFALLGTVAIVYVLREVRAFRKGMRLPSSETSKTLQGLEKSMATRGM